MNFVHVMPLPEGKHVPDFLQEMAAASRDRLDRARRKTPEDLLRQHAAEALPVRPLPRSFLLIAEVKRISPAAGPLAAADLSITEQAKQYAAGNASVISVLTEPTRFGGSLADLQSVTAAVPIPAMRKDFLVDPYQIIEARAHGASGVLLIIKMLDDDTLHQMIATAAAYGMFTLIEAFDREDLNRCSDLLQAAQVDQNFTLLGLNTRDLRNLSIRPERLAELADAFPPGCRRIAESGLDTPADIELAAAFGYGGALVGTALMRSAEPATLCRAMVHAGERIHAISAHATSKAPAPSASPPSRSTP